MQESVFPSVCVSVCLWDDYLENKALYEVQVYCPGPRDVLSQDRSFLDEWLSTNMCKCVHLHVELPLAMDTWITAIQSPFTWQYTLRDPLHLSNHKSI